MPSTWPGLGQRSIGVGQPLGQAEVGDEPRSLGIDEHVRGLQVAVQDPALVGVVHGPDHGEHALDFRARIAPGMLRQRGPLDELHRVVLLALVLAHLVDRHDVGVVEVRRRLGLGVEPLDVTARGEAAGEDHLERDEPVERHLPRLVDDPHPAPGDLLQQLVVAEVADGRQFGVAVRLDRFVASSPSASRKGEATRSMRSRSAKKA